ncbi:MAG: SurA N-terminal domain-containing protein [Pontixanthobacter sp.]
MNTTKLILPLLALAALAGCDKEATGQVAAVVNGEEITLQEVNAEMGDAANAEGADKEAIQQAALQRIVERRLMAQLAREEGLDETQDYLLRSRQLDDALLVQLMGQKAERAVKVPERQDIDAYVKNNPVMFGERKILTIDRIQFPVPADFSKLQALENDNSMAAVANRLNLLNIDFNRDRAKIDSAQLGQERLQQIRALPDGEPFVIPEGGVVTVGVIVGEEDAAMTADQSRQMAVQAMRNERLQETLQERLKTARTSAEIDYQDGFAPPTKGGSAPAKKAE